MSKAEWQKIRFQIRMTRKKKNRKKFQNNETIDSWFENELMKELKITRLFFFFFLFYEITVRRIKQTTVGSVRVSGWIYLASAIGGPAWSWWNWRPDLRSRIIQTGGCVRERERERKKREKVEIKRVGRKSTLSQYTVSPRGGSWERKNIGSIRIGYTKKKKNVNKQEKKGGQGGKKNLKVTGELDESD